MTAAATTLTGGGPAASGERFRAPSEEAPHARTWLAWPSTASIYGGGAYFEDVQQTLGRLARAIAEHEPVTMCAGADHHALARELCGPKVALADIPTDDMWARDSGPVFLTGDRGGLAALDLSFNGWGSKQRHSRDGDLADAIAAHRGCPLIDSGLVGEGGGIEYDGDGTLLLTDSCWVNGNRNPDLSRDEIEARLKAGLGVDKVIWLPGVKGQDITDGHIDGLIRFIRPGLLMTGSYPDDDSDFGLALEESVALLRRETDARGRTFDIVDVTAAVDVRSTHPDFFRGYANFYVGNDAVYTPEFGDRSADTRAQEQLERLFPDRRIVALDVDRIYENGGGIHCVTQQEPLTG